MASEKPAMAQKIAKRDGGWFCHYCGESLLPFGEPGSTCTIDHKYPRSKGGGRYAVGNCVLACKTCNEEKADTPYHTYLFLWRKRKEAI